MNLSIHLVDHLDAIVYDGYFTEEGSKGFKVSTGPKRDAESHLCDYFGCVISYP